MMSGADYWLDLFPDRTNLGAVPPYRGLKAWAHARRLAVECSKAAQALPRAEQPALAAQLREAGYAVVLRIAAGGCAGPISGRRAALHDAQRSLAAIDTILCIAHDLEYLSSRDYARLEAWLEETGKTLYGLLRKVEANSTGPRVS
jgi:four helix bundle protein